LKRAAITIGYIIFTASTILVLYLAYRLVAMGPETQFSLGSDEYEEQEFIDIARCLDKISADQILVKFPVELYLTYSNYKEIEKLSADLDAVDSTFNAPILVTESLFYSILADSLISNFKSEFSSYNPDFLLDRLIWAREFLIYSEVYPARRVLFKAIYSSWMDKISNSLSTYLEENSNLKHQFSYKFLHTECSLANYQTPLGLSKSEKIVDNLIQSKYKYIWDRFWFSTGWLSKLFVVFFLCATLLCYYWTLKSLAKHLLKK
jgi:hypothetical protein